MVLLFNGCSNENNEQTSAGSADETGGAQQYVQHGNCQRYSKGVHHSSGQLNYLNWSDYTSPRLIPCFEKLTGIKVSQDYTTSDNMTKAKLLTGHSGFDVVEQGALYLPKEIPAGAFAELDKSRLSNYDNRNRAIYRKVAKTSDPGNKHAIVYSYGTTGIGYNQQAVNKRLGKGTTLDQWKYLFEPEYLKKFQDCGISMLDEPEQVFGNLLHYMGKDPNSTNPADYRQAARYLLENVRPYLTYFDSNRYESDLAAGNLCLVMGYSGDVMRSYAMSRASHTKAPIRYRIPEGGTAIFFDLLMIPKDARHKDAAYQFLNFMLNPHVAATNSNYISQPNAVNGSLPYMSDIFKDKNVNPTAEMIKDMYLIKMWEPKLQEYINHLWFAVKFGITIKK